MSKDDIPNQNKLIGEGTSIWFILSLLFIGIISSITAAWMLLPPGMTIDTFKSWLVPTTDNVRAPEAPLTVMPTPEAPMAAATATATVTQVKPSVDAPPAAAEGEHEDQVSRVPPARVEQAISPLSGEQIADQPKVEADEQRVAQITQDDLDRSPMPGDKAAAMDDFAAAEARSQSATNTEKAQDCAPHFFVQFRHDGIRPMDLDLSEEATRFREWLSLHPEAKLLVEGHADSSGPEEYNLFISHRRAKAVYNILASLGIPDNQMAIRAFGEYSPLEGLPSESRKNRRVALRIEGAQACSNLLSNGDKK